MVAAWRVADVSSYLVGYYSSWAMEGPSNQVMFVGKDGNTAFKPVGVYVCNHPWPYYDCLHGGGAAAGLEEGGYFDLTAVGVDADGNETTTTIRMAEKVNGTLNALNDWTFFDLSSLGEVESVYFTLNSTDTGAYGMNTTAVENVNLEKAVAGVKYVNINGMVSDKPFDGVNVVVTSYTDGTTSTTKVVK